MSNFRCDNECYEPQGKSKKQLSAGSIVISYQCIIYYIYKPLWFIFWLLHTGNPYMKLKAADLQYLTFFFPISFAGGTVSEEKQKDAGHFDPIHHSHCSNYYSFWNKVLIMHSSGLCFSVWVFVVRLCGHGLGLGLGSTQNKADCLSYPPGNDKKNSTSLCRCTLGYVEVFCGWF